MQSFSEGKLKSENEPVGVSRPRAGRPARGQQEKRHEELLNVALDIFLERGFEQATMVEIATAVGMSKRTVYALYEDKAALFKATVRRAVERYTIPREAIDPLVTDNLEQTLTAIAHQRVMNMSTPVAVKLQRILSAQSYRFPELFHIAFEEGAGPAVDVLSSVFVAHTAKGEIAVAAPRRAAVAFLSLVVSGPARLFVLGEAMPREEIDSRISFAISLFLNGVRVR